MQRFRGGKCAHFIQNLVVGPGTQPERGPEWGQVPRAGGHSTGVSDSGEYSSHWRALSTAPRPQAARQVRKTSWRRLHQDGRLEGTQQ